MYHMKTASIRDIHHDFARVLTWIEEGEQVQITKRKRVVARLVPVKAKPTKLKWPDLAARRKKIFPSGVQGKPVSEIVSDGRGDY